MPRKSRIEFAGAHYPVINRGNYKDWIFKTDSGRRSPLERTLADAGWIAERLNMEATSYVQSLVSLHRKKKHGGISNWILLNHETLDWCFFFSWTDLCMLKKTLTSVG